MIYEVIWSFTEQKNCDINGRLEEYVWVYPVGPDLLSVGAVYAPTHIREKGGINLRGNTVQSESLKQEKGGGEYLQFSKLVQN